MLTSEEITFAEFLSNTHVVTAAQDRIVRIWDAAERRTDGIFSGHRRGVAGVAVDLANRQLITASGKELLRFNVFDDVKDLIIYTQEKVSTRDLSDGERKRFGLEIGDQCPPSENR